MLQIPCVVSTLKKQIFLPKKRKFCGFKNLKEFKLRSLLIHFLGFCFKTFLDFFKHLVNAFAIRSLFGHSITVLFIFKLLFTVEFQRQRFCDILNFVLILKVLQLAANGNRWVSTRSDSEWPGFLRITTMYVYNIQYKFRERLKTRS